MVDVALNQIVHWLCYDNASGSFLFCSISLMVVVQLSGT